MTVYVDDAIHSWRGRLWAHLFSTDLDELHAFARRLGLSRSWFQAPPKASWPHYDVVEGMRFQALRLGAVAADRCTTLEVAWTLQGALTPERIGRLAARRATLAVRTSSAGRPEEAGRQMALPGF
ncbi:DUF4031 domain-containing protein [Methylobacterium radiotolerans]|uniref:DUF4031 domain-containing protein n=1 Tax=Methylobacterium radiotolerans TaxID=31998 RepID=UPI0038D1CBD4